MIDAAPFQKESATSKEAARRISPRVSQMEVGVLEAVGAAQAGGGSGLTDDELIVAFGTHSVRPRRIFLTAIGKLRDSGGTRKTRSGRAAVVWCLA